MKYYAVANGKKPGIYLSWEECKELVWGKSGAKYKSFDTQEEAEAFYAKYNNGQLPKNRDYADQTVIEKRKADKLNKHMDVCLLCGRPFKQQRGKNNTRKMSGLCISCKGKQQKVKSAIKHATNGEVGWLSVDELLYIKKQYECEDAFSYAINHPKAIFDAKCNARPNMYISELKKSRQGYYAENGYSIAPLYVKSLLGEGKEFIGISGDKRDPRITFRCKRCDCDFTVKYKSLIKHKTHDCSALVSSGEAIVKAYLDQIGIQYLTQRNTLKCVNPDTGFVMPYDFELPKQMVIIEVQGEQHRKFIERFHVDQDGFMYQQKRDAYKKHYAEEHGYRFIELWYDDFINEKYKAIIYSAISIK